MNVNIDPTLKNERFVSLVRCSTDQQTDTSIPDQIQLLHSFGAAQGMTHAGEDFVLDGVSGSHPGARDDLAKIIRRKQERNDFNVLLVQDMSRLTRAGAEHGAKIEWELAGAGIRIVFAAGHLPEGDHSGIVKSVEYYSAQQFAKSVSFSVARGQMSALTSGRMLHCLRPPYAIDRLYLSADGKPLYVVRNNPNGTQDKIEPTTNVILQTYPRAEKGQPPMRYRKQAGEQIVLVPGAPELLEVVRRMFRRALINGWGSHLIARELNDLGVPSSAGKRWTTGAVEVVLRNSVYLGKGIANRSSRAVYHERSPNAPTRININRQDWINLKRPRTRRRKRSEWVEQQHPMLEQFLPAELKELAIAYQARFVAGGGLPKRPRGDKHVDSPYILKGILCSKRSRLPMSGRTKGSKGHTIRYYQVGSASLYPSSDPNVGRMVRADAIESAVMKAVREILVPSHDLRQRVEAAIREHHARVDNDTESLKVLVKQRAAICVQIEFVVDELGAIGRDAAKGKIAKLEATLIDLDQRIAQVGAASVGGIVNVEAAVGQVIDRLHRMGESLERLPKAVLRSLLEVMVARLEIDLETKEIEMELALPNWAVLDLAKVGARMGLDENFLLRTVAEAHTEQTPTIAVFGCDRLARDCYTCRRRAA